MNRNWIYLLALLLLPLIRILVNDLHYDEWLSGGGYQNAANFVASVRGNHQFQAFIGGYVFPVFLAMVLIYWMILEDKSGIPLQFLMLPLAYIPISVVGFTLVNADFQVSYLYVNTLIILTCGYAYVGFWFGLVTLLEKLHLVE